MDKGLDRRSSEARALLNALDAELAASAQRRGYELAWSAAERTVLALIGDQIDRKVELLAEYQEAVEAKDRSRLSGEIRLLENSVARLLNSVHTDDVAVPKYSPYESQATKHARTAAMKRWHPGWTPGAAG